MTIEDRGHTQRNDRFLQNPTGATNVREEDLDDSPLQSQALHDDEPLSLGARRPLISSFKSLAIEADVNAPHPASRVRLVDQARGKHEPALWNELLNYRQQADGVDGIRDIWHGMRGRNIDLPTGRGPTTTNLWQTFAVAIPHAELLSYAEGLYERSGANWPGLYPTFIRAALASERPHEAIEFAARLAVIGVSSAGALQFLVHDAVLSTESLNAYRRLYGQSTDRNVYSALMFALYEKDRYSEALYWHRHLLEMGDVPTSYHAVRPLARHFAKHKAKVEKIISSCEAAGVPVPALNVKALRVSENAEELVMSPPEQLFGVRPKSVSDEWAARAFATTSWSLKAVIDGLTTFGLRLLGPLAMRELALRCETPSELIMRLEQLDEKQVEMSDMIFCRLLRKLADEDDQAMMDSVLQSDLHPDVYEDAETQRRLMDLYLSSEDLRQVYRTLIVLTTYHDETSEKIWNYLLLKAMEQKSWKLIENILEDIVQNQVPVSQENIRSSFYCLIEWRRYQHNHTTGHKSKPWNSPTDKRLGQRGLPVLDVIFVANMWLKILRAGGHVFAKAWNRIFVSLGMEQRLGSLESLAIWVAAIYSARARRSLQARHEVRTIFSDKFAYAVVAWGFKSLGKRIPRTSRASPLGSLPEADDWSRGLRLLKFLRDRHGVPVSADVVRVACYHRLAQLYGAHKSSRLENVFAQKNNTLPATAMVRAIDEMMGSDLLSVPAEIVDDETRLRQWIERLASADMKATLRRGFGAGRGGKARRGRGDTSRLEEPDPALGQIEDTFVRDFEDEKEQQASDAPEAEEETVTVNARL